MIVGSRQGREPPPGRHRDATPRGHLAVKLFKEGTPFPAMGGTLFHGRGGNERRSLRQNPPHPQTPEEVSRRSLWGNINAFPGVNHLR